MTEPDGEALRKPAEPARRGAPVRLDRRTFALLGRYWREWLSPRWRELLLCFALMAVVAATTGAYGLIVRELFDAMKAGDVGFLWPAVGTIIAVTMLRAVFLYLEALVTSKTVLRTAVDLQKAGYAHLLRSDFARIARDTPGHLVSRLTNDIAAMQQATTALVTTSVRDTLTLVATTCVMIYIDWALSLVVLCIYPLAAFPIIRIGQRLRQVAKRTQAELGDMTSQLTESLSGARLIKTFRLEDYATARTNASFDQILRLRLKAVQSKASLDPMLEVLAGLALGGVTAFVGYRMSQGLTTIGDFMGFLTALFASAQPLRGFGAFNARLQEGLGALERMFEMLDEKPEIVDRPGARPLAVRKGAIDFDRVTFAYGDDLPAIRDFTLAVPGGSSIALVGRSGAGKSTVLNLVPRLFEPQQGTIRIDGQEIRDVQVASLRDAISIVSQEITLFNDTVRANIALGRLGASDADIVRAAEAAAATGFIGELPMGYDTVIGDRGMRLSGGQRQRLALARAILKNAPILLLDEATSALDTESERLVQQALQRFSRGRTTLVIAHRLSTVQSADLICVMEEGSIVETGRHAELLARNGVYSRLCRSQFLTETGRPVVDAAAEGG